MFSTRGSASRTIRSGPLGRCYTLEDLNFHLGTGDGSQARKHGPSYWFVLWFVTKLCGPGHRWPKGRSLSKVERPPPGNSLVQDVGKTEFRFQSPPWVSCFLLSE